MIKKLSLLIFLFLLFGIICYVLNILEPEYKRLNHGEDYIQKIHSLEKISGNLFLVISTVDQNSERIILMNVRSDGVLVWKKNIADNKTSHKYLIVNFTNNKIIVTIYYDKFTKLIKLDTNQNILWEKTYKYITVLPLKENDEIVIAERIETRKNWKFDYKTTLMKLDKTGNILWTKSNFEVILNLLETQNQELLLIGNPIFKLDQNGGRIWEKTIEFSFGQAIETQNANMVLGATRNLIPGTPATQVNIIKLDHMGNKLWQKIYNKKYLNSLESIKSVGDNDFIAHCISYDWRKEQCVWVFQGNEDGEIVWEKLFQTKYRWPYSTLIKTKQGYLVTITSHNINHTIIINLDKKGNVLWRKRYRGEVYQTLEDTDGYTMVGIEKGNKTDYTFIFKLDFSGNRIW